MKSTNLLSRKRLIPYLFLAAAIFFAVLLVREQLVFADDSAPVSSDTTMNKAAAVKPQPEAKLISITLKETDIREVLNILAFKGGVNIVAGDDVDSKISVQLKDVPWEQALDVILKTYNYTYKREGNLIRVMSLARAMEEEGKTPLKTKILPLNFADVNLLKDSLSKMLSKRGTMEIDKRTNSLIITDIPEMVDAIEQSAMQLDTLTPQVLIEAMMVDIKITDNNEWGSILNMVDLKSPQDGNHLTSAVGNTATATTGGLFNFSAITDNLNVTGTVNAMVSQGMASILANPKVLTLDNQAANIEISTEIPYSESIDSGSGVTTTIKFKDAGIKLSVTPHITSGKFISMNVSPEQSFRSGFAEGTTQPIIDKRKAETNLLVKDGQTIVIGGLRQTTDNFDMQKVPVLGDVPFLGLFFRSKVRKKVETELVIFVTPHIIQTSLLTDKEMELLQKLDNTKRLVVDERSEMQRFKDYMKISDDKHKAEKIADHETQRKRVQRQTTDVAKPDKYTQYDTQVPAPQTIEKPSQPLIQPEKNMPQEINREQELPPVMKQEVKPATQADSDALDLEAAKFRESLNSIKKQY
jgi:type IV pilus secretin PilQ/predicted competence protein